MKLIRLVLLLGTLCNCAYGQDGSYHASLEAQAGIIAKSTVPFWLRSDQFGSVPLPGVSGSFIAAVRKDYDSSGSRMVDWGAAGEARADLGSSSRLTLIEGYVKVRGSIFELKAGRVKDFTGLVDSSLSSGSFAISGNALGIPKVQLSIPNFWTMPFFGRLFAVKGNISQGWLGKLPVSDSAGNANLTTYFHQTSFYARFGKPEWRVKLYAGFNHQVFWGSEKELFGDKYRLSGLKTYEYVLLGRTYLGSKIGNHLGTVDLGMEYNFSSVKIFLYRQNFYDEGALAKLANIADGLNGLSIQNNNQDINGFQWRKFVVEIFYSKDQAGYPSSRRTASGDENYYNNYQYAQGWSYKGVGLGSPFITPATTTRAGFPNGPADFFNNNRVIALYAGMEGSIENYAFRAKGSYSFNYGTFGTSPYGSSTGSVFSPPVHGIFKEVEQLSIYLEASRTLKYGWVAGLAAALDEGHLFYNSAGLILKLKRSF
jgi:hypothetical protein